MSRDPATRVGEGSRKGQGRVKERSGKGQGRVEEGEIHIPRFDDPLGEHLIKKKRITNNQKEDLTTPMAKSQANFIMDYMLGTVADLKNPGQPQQKPIWPFKSGGHVV